LKQEPPRAAKVPAIPVVTDFQALLGSPRLLPGEDGAAYQALLGRIRAAVWPEDTVDEMLARDLADLSRDVHRSRRWKVKYLQVEQARKLDDAIARNMTLGMTMPREERAQLSDGWRTGNPVSITKAEYEMARRGIDREVLAVEGLPPSARWRSWSTWRP
jgi:hypothetical protein